jgi:hypothetical protein
MFLAGLLSLQACPILATPNPRLWGNAGFAGCLALWGSNESRNTVTNVQILQVTEKRLSLLSGPSLS